MGVGLRQAQGTPVWLSHRRGSPHSPAAEEGSDGRDTDTEPDTELHTELGPGRRC